MKLTKGAGKWILLAVAVLMIFGSGGSKKGETEVRASVSEPTAAVTASPRPTATPAPTKAPKAALQTLEQPAAPEDYAAEVSKAMPTAEPTPDPAPAVKSVEQTYILNTNTKKFHLPGCSSVGKMKESNKREYTGTRDDVLGMGYSPCGNCHP